jgi:hypothetical protein
MRISREILERILGGSTLEALNTDVGRKREKQEELPEGAVAGTVEDFDHRTYLKQEENVDPKQSSTWVRCPLF